MKAMFDTVDRLERTLDFHKDRHAVLAGNLANLETPGYRPLDLAEAPSNSGSTGALGAEELSRTNSAHLSASGEAAPLANNARVFEDETNTPGVDGNAISLERELAKVDANRIRYNTASELVSRKLALIRYCAGDGQQG